MSSAIVNRAIDILDNEKTDLMAAVKDARTKVRTLSNFILRTPDVYDAVAGRSYLALLMELRDTMGISLQMIIEIDGKGEKRPQEEPKTNSSTAVYVSPPAQPSGISSQEENGKGIGEYIIEYLKERALQKKELGPTQILQSVEVVDVLNLGRQALPALNNLLRWHEDNIFHLMIFDTPLARRYFNEREKGYLTRLLNTVSSFLIASENYTRTRMSEKITRVGEAVARQPLGQGASSPAGPTS